MSNYQRVYLKGGTYFFTVVTYKRIPIFKEENNIDLLKYCFQNAMASYPFRIDAIVILPGHLHTIWTLPNDESDFSVRWKKIKRDFSRYYSESRTKDVSRSMLKKNEKGTWQRRFWEHLIRDETDFNRHCDYIHYNPVKHALANSLIEWKHSSFRNLVDKGLYPVNWGSQVDMEIMKMDY